MIGAEDLVVLEGATPVLDPQSAIGHAVFITAVNPGVGFLEVLAETGYGVASVTG